MLAVLYRKEETFLFSFVKNYYSENGRLCTWANHPQRSIYGHMIDLSMKMATSGLVIFVCLASLLVGSSSAGSCPKHKGCEATCSGKHVDLSSIVKSG